MSSLKKFAPSLLALSLSAAMLSACNKSNDNPQPPAPTSAGTAATPAPASTAANPQGSAYTPPTAAQLSQLVAPIAIFPDKLVAQVLAGSTYPDQVEAAYQWQQQNAALKGTALQNAVDTQPWDDSVKALTTFPEVLHQMAGNLPWTTALGDAYVHDPSDVMNEIQTLRQLAVTAGNLKSNQCMNVTSVPRSSMPPPPTTAPTTTLVDNGPPVYSGPAVVQEPQQVIEIEPADPAVVYVPTYDPAVVYGAPIAVYPGYVYDWPRPVYAGPYYGDIAFGVGIAIGLGFGHPWGWGAWGVNWGWHPGWGHGGPGWGRGGPGWGYHGPAVVYNHNTYISHSNTVINHFNNSNIVNNRYAGNAPGLRGAAFGHAPAAMAGAAMGAAAMHGAFANRGMNPQMGAAMAQRAAARPNFANMSMPRFSHAMATPGFRGGLGATAGAAATHAAFDPANRMAAARANVGAPQFNRGANMPGARNGAAYHDAATSAQARGFAATRGDEARSPAMQNRGFTPQPREAAGAGFAGQGARESAYRSAQPSYQRSYQPRTERSFAQPQRSFASHDFSRPSAPAYHPMASAPRSFGGGHSGGGGGGNHGGGHASAPHGGGGGHHER